MKGSINGRPLLQKFINDYIKFTPGKIAIIQYETGNQLLYRQLDRLTKGYMLNFRAMGLKQGDRLAASGLLGPDYIAIMLACFRMGIVFAPVDPKLSDPDLVQRMNLIRPKAFCFQGKHPKLDLRRMGALVRKACDYSLQLIQIGKGESFLIPGAMASGSLLKKQRLVRLHAQKKLGKYVRKKGDKLHGWCPALIVWDKDFDGNERPVVLSHENVLAQHNLMHSAGAISAHDKTLINTAPHELCTLVHGVISTLMNGSTLVLAHGFDAVESLNAVQKHSITRLVQPAEQFRRMATHVQVPAMSIDSLETGLVTNEADFHVWGRHAEKLCKEVCSGVYQAEAGGFISLDTVNSRTKLVGKQQEWISVRESIRPNGKAGEVLPEGLEGDLYCHSPFVFLGYYGQGSATSQVLTKEGHLYTRKKAKISNQILHIDPPKKIAISA